MNFFYRGSGTGTVYAQKTDDYVSYTAHGHTWDLPLWIEIDKSYYINDYLPRYSRFLLLESLHNNSGWDPYEDLNNSLCDVITLLENYSKSNGTKLISLSIDDGLGSPIQGVLFDNEYRNKFELREDGTVTAVINYLEGFTDMTGTYLYSQNNIHLSILNYDQIANLVLQHKNYYYDVASGDLYSIGAGFITFRF